MRDIEFRGKRIDNGEWVEGYYYKAKYYRTDDELCDYITVPHPKEYNEPSSHYMVNPETVGQYTELKDKNGTKIFEGDIGRRRDDIFLIDWSEEKAAFVMIFNDYICEILYLEEMWDDAEVIGNIHDNPELLEV